MIYLDHHATTPVLPEVVEAMGPFWSETFGNPSSAHAYGRKARQALEDARELVADLLGSHPDEVIFTSGATESNNLAIFGLLGDPSGHVLAAPIEHPCVIEPLKYQATRGFDVEWLPVPPDGMVRAEAIAERIRPQTRLITLMMVNHETGAIQPIRHVANHIRVAAFHTDAAQAVGKIPVSFHELCVTTLSASGHKIGAPKGVGLLLLRRGVALRPLFFGGHQQKGRRPGTEPVALAVGFAKALEIACAPLQSRLATVRHLREMFMDQLRGGVASLRINSPGDGSPYVANISFPGCRAELLLMKLDLMGIACSTGSACSSGSLLPSPVLQAMGVDAEILHSAMRFSFSSDMSPSDIGEAARRIVKAVNDLRSEELPDIS